MAQPSPAASTGGTPANPAPANLPLADAGSGAVQEIIVTAEKRATNLQRTPIAVTALKGAELERAQVTNLQTASALVPSFKAAEAGGFGQITIRGIGIQNFISLAESAVAVNLNEVYVSRPVSFLTSMFDVSTLEVLRGPQGTLYGRNATAGSVNITTTRPTENWSGTANLTYGNYNEVRAQAAVGGPVIGDKVLIRIAGFYERHDGYGTNITTGTGIDNKNAYGLRGTVVVNLASDLKATAIVEHYREKDHNAGYHYFGDAGLIGLPGTVGTVSLAKLLGATVVQGGRDIANDADPQFYLKTTTATGILDWGRGPVTLRSITGYRDQAFQNTTDLDGSSLPLSLYLGGEPDQEFSQEVQAHYDTKRLHITVGGYYYHEKDNATPSIAAFSTLAIDGPLGIPQRPAQLVNFANLGGTIYTRALAAFAQGTWEFAQGLSLTAGIRYSSERKHLFQRYAINPFEPYSPNDPSPPSVDIPPRTFASTTPRLGLQYQVTPKTLLYATYAKGFKSGSFDAATGLAFLPEKLDDFEGGVKTTLFDNRFRANIAGFYYRYSDLQVSQTIGLAIETTNAAKARLYGVEGEFAFVPNNAIEIALNGSYLHTRYGSYSGADSARPFAGNVDFTGHRLNNAPSFSGTLSVQYTYPMSSGAIVLRGEGEYSSRFYFTPGNYNVASQGAYSKLNAFLSYNLHNGWNGTVFARNITNKTTKTSAVIQTALLGTSVQGSIAAPRTFGLQVGYHF